MPTTIDLSQWPRREHLAMFKTFDDPTFSVTVDVEVTGLMKNNGVPNASLFLRYLHATLKAINATDNLKLRIDGDNVVEYDTIHGNTTFLNKDNLFGFCEVLYQADLCRFATAAQGQLHQCKQKTSQLLQVAPRLDVVYFSCLPWIQFTQFKHPHQIAQNHSIPKVMFGKLYQKHAKHYLPIGITVHHGLVDGLHVGELIEHLEHICHTSVG